ncbi:MAG: malto-oligosyltrehalose synthase, partial [Magnetococcales bacterium]|nr:malto-oligosyltrehalose synthase [Magnetococcales bacterium]
EGGLKPANAYPRQAVTAIGNYDMPTLRGFWLGSDIDARARLQLFSSEEQYGQMVVDRAQDRARCLMALEREGLLPGEASIHPVSVPDITLPFTVAFYTYLARTEARIVLVRPEDVFGVIEQNHLPGSSNDQYPNWRRRLPLDLEDWHDHEHFIALREMLCNERGSAVPARERESQPVRLAVIPRATYRLQLNKDLTFKQATALIPYLAELGISHCYASPYLKARPGSTHGYDIVDHTALNPEIGTLEDYEDFFATLQKHGLGQILDVVPNHMGVMGADNRWWLDVLENGPASVWGAFFDIDWNPLNSDLRDKVLLPLLGDHYGAVLNRGELNLQYDSDRGEFSLFYYQHRLPIDPATYPRIVGHRNERLAAIMVKDNKAYSQLQTLLTAFGHLPERTTTNPARIVERQRDKEEHKSRLAALSQACSDIRHHIADVVDEFNGRPGDSASFDMLHDLIQLQGYRLAYWRVAADEINYRRFFDINDLAALRMEEPKVFDATHCFLQDLISQGKVDGLRIDHPDGLLDPGGYFCRLQHLAGGSIPVPGEPLPLYLVIEKILADHERLPDEWPIHGATGYRFANLVNNLFVNNAAEKLMTHLYHEFTNTDVDFDTMAYRAKKMIMHTSLSSELTVLAASLARIAAADRNTRDFTLNGLREALMEVVASFPVYRSYVSGEHISADDRRNITWAINWARKRNRATNNDIFFFLQDVLTLDIARGRSASFRQGVQTFAMKFQQFTSPVMAKGVEDTAFYRYNRLISLNDVGGDPRRFGVSVAAFHAATRTRAARWPHNLLATSTHDSKRSEDVRARINVISEMPESFSRMIKRWNRINRSRKRVLDDLEAPTCNDEYLLYQTLIGTWPLTMPDEGELVAYRTRIRQYMIKALRESKEHSSWINVNVEYEEATGSFIDSLLASGDKNSFLSDFLSSMTGIAHHGLLNSLAQTLIKMTSPGVPDIYQGCELWQFYLVDPDNRQPVDFAHRSHLLDQVRACVLGAPEEWPHNLQPLLANMADGRVKLYTIWQTLALRKRWPEVFREGGYVPLMAQGEAASHVCAYARCQGDR